MFPERDRQDDCVGLEGIPQRLGDYRASNRPSLRCQRLRRPAARDGHVDVSTGEGVGEGLAYERIDEELQRDEANAAAARFALYLEDAAQEIGEALEIDVKFNRRGEYTLDPLLTAIRTRLEKKLGGAHPLVASILRITQDNAYRNWGIHCKNAVSAVTSAEIGTVVSSQAPQR
jgi:hypothetical protein